MAQPMRLVVTVTGLDEVLDRHEPMEAVGGYIECSCGWPTRDQFEAGEHFAVHILPELGVTVRTEASKAEPS